MPRVKKSTLHLRNIVRRRKLLTPEPFTPTLNQGLEDENVIYVQPVREGNEIQELSRDMEEWGAILAEPDSDGPVDDDTDEDDWQEARRTLESGEDWSGLLQKMQLAAAA
ncbi:hypothetical protein BGZ79_003674, partial [Entomortierella chlamydospora]